MDSGVAIHFATQVEPSTTRRKSNQGMEPPQPEIKGQGDHDDIKGTT
jgi:hypothetical protein